MKDIELIGAVCKGSRGDKTSGLLCVGLLEVLGRLGKQSSTEICYVYGF